MLDTIIYGGIATAVLTLISLIAGLILAIDYREYPFWKSKAAIAFSVSAIAALTCLGFIGFFIYGMSQLGPY